MCAPHTDRDRCVRCACAAHIHARLSCTTLERGSRDDNDDDDGDAKIQYYARVSFRFVSYGADSVTAVIEQNILLHSYA